MLRAATEFLLVSIHLDLRYGKVIYTFEKIAHSVIFLNFLPLTCSISKPIGCADWLIDLLVGDICLGVKNEAQLTLSTHTHSLTYHNYRVSFPQDTHTRTHTHSLDWYAKISNTSRSISQASENNQPARQPTNHPVIPADR